MHGELALRCSKCRSRKFSGSISSWAYGSLRIRRVRVPRRGPVMDEAGLPDRLPIVESLIKGITTSKGEDHPRGYLPTFFSNASIACQ